MSGVYNQESTKASGAEGQDSGKNVFPGKKLDTSKQTNEGAFKMENRIVVDAPPKQTDSKGKQPPVIFN